LNTTFEEDFLKLSADVLGSGSLISSTAFDVDGIASILAVVVVFLITLVVHALELELEASSLSLLLRFNVSVH
jgi:hypothetical protein